MQQLCLQVMISSSIKQISFALIANFCKKKRLRWKMKVTNNRLADGGEVIQLILNFNSISFVWCRSGFLRLYHETNRVDNVFLQLFNGLAISSCLVTMAKLFTFCLTLCYRSLPQNNISSISSQTFSNLTDLQYL